MSEVDYQNAVHLAAIIEGQLSTDRPDAAIMPTSNPGSESEHYIGLVMRVYSDKNNLHTFRGYITFRYCEVKRKAKISFLPLFSSIELRDTDFKPFPTPVKVHFAPLKVQTDDSIQYLDAVTEVANSGVTDAMEKEALFRSKIGESSLKKIYAKILDLIDGII